MSSDMPPLGRELGHGEGDSLVSSHGEALIFVADASAEAEQLTSALRSRGYVVVDVPLALLVNRVAVQVPALILCDVDAEGAIETTGRLRDVPGGSSVDVIFIGESGRTLDKMADEVAHESSGVFMRPVDVPALLRKVEGLIGAPPDRGGGSGNSFSSRAPVLVASSRKPYRYEAGRGHLGTPPPSSVPPSSAGPISSASPGEPSGGPESARAPRSSPVHELIQQPLASAESVVQAAASGKPMTVGEHVQSPRLSIPQAEVSPELRRLLMEAEQKLVPSLPSVLPARRLAPEEEVEAVLPGEVLAALDEPLDLDDEDDMPSASGGTRGGSEVGTSAGRSVAPSTASAENVASAGVGVPNEERDQRSTSPPRRAESEQATALPQAFAADSSMGAAAATPRHAMVTRQPPARPPTMPPSGRTSVEAPAGSQPMLPEKLAKPSTKRPQRVLASAGSNDALPIGATYGRGPEIPAALAPGEAVHALAVCIGARYTGALALEDEAGIRRVVFRDGDFVTVASGAENESLVLFLAQRGDLGPDTAARLARRLPQFGRHAGAALIAHGHLRQDELWSVLRAHAEWLLALIIQMNQGAASLESTVPPRLQAEPAVFGGTTGAEVFIEILRRVLAPDVAVRRLGGREARIDDGSAKHLLAECALSDPTVSLVQHAAGLTLGEAMERGESQELAAVLYGLRELSVIEVLPADSVRQTEPPAETDALDEAALRERITARRALVEEGDYFAVLGISRLATTYDVKRAYLRLRRQFDPNRILTPATAELRDDVDLIVQVLEEAYDVLRDELRRERYRRALEAPAR